MELEVYWNDFSKKTLNIFDYYNENARINVAKNLVIGFINQAVKLKKQPKIGKERLINLLYHFKTNLSPAL
ncbi:hypothetical protein [Flavobacterium sp.]|uniref:hypothetical protein n=1 Tax=Flavobacterium sp. TaxID=239 RepID=UPI0026244606|nr:hypothetical protein [Flavobacterium sp.]MDD2987080.1 hypothetical protein [Flavobacterium sp.]